eukprot:m.218407 g.218407  ORF g.218407 m.218407 type:complete len:399 (+) comp29640_c0_seq1:263-1459(+)
MGEVVLDGTGLGALPDQLHAAASDKGFEFNVMVAGETGLGKSTFMNAMFASELHTLKPYSEGDYRVPPTNETVSQTFELTEKGVTLTLTLVDTPGFASAIDNTGCWSALVAELEGRLRDYMTCETRVERDAGWPDRRIHCLLFFMAPTGHGLKPLDAAVIRAVQPLVNVIPVIGKSDLLTAKEKDVFRARVKADLDKAGISTYTFADDEGDGNEWRHSMPFCVSAGASIQSSFGGTRDYPWGAHNPADPKQSDASTVRRLLVRTYLHNLVADTHTNVYEAYRARELAAATGSGGDDDSDRCTSPLVEFEELTQGQTRKRDAIERDMEAAFKATVADQERELRELESALLEEHEALQRNLVELKRSLEEKTEEFQAQKKLAEAKPAPPPTNQKSRRLFK